MKNIILIAIIAITTSVSTLLFAGNINITISYQEKETLKIKQNFIKKEPNLYQQVDINKITKKNIEKNDII